MATDYGIKISKEGKSVLSPDLGDMISTSNMVRVSYVITTVRAIPVATTDLYQGFIHYIDVTGPPNYYENYCLSLDFWKESNLTIESVDLKTIYSDANILGTIYELDSTEIRLNATKTLDDSNYFYRYSGGTSIGTDTITADEQEKAHSFSAAQIAAVTDGWNQVIIQQQNNDTDGNDFGFAVANLLITGYLTL